MSPILLIASLLRSATPAAQHQNSNNITGEHRAISKLTSRPAWYTGVQQPVHRRYAYQYTRYRVHAVHLPSRRGGLPLLPNRSVPLRHCRQCHPRGPRTPCPREDAGPTHEPRQRPHRARKPMLYCVFVWGREGMGRGRGRRAYSSFASVVI